MEVKPHLTYEAQLELLKSRGMQASNEELALSLLKQVGYYTLSGYSLPYRLRGADGTRTERFRPGTSIESIKALWDFDARLRTVAFSIVAHTETHIRALLAYSLGSVDPQIHLKPELLSIDSGTNYPKWRQTFEKKLADSREEFVVHHRTNRAGLVPIWVAVEVLDWGGLSHLFSMAPLKVRTAVASEFNLNAAQLKSWLRCLNVVRNVCAHHSRFFNRYYSLTPKLPPPGTSTSLAAAHQAADTTFGMLTLLQHLGSFCTGANARSLPAVLATFPVASGLDVRSTGAPLNWSDLPLWRNPPR